MPLAAEAARRQPACNQQLRDRVPSRARRAGLAPNPQQHARWTRRVLDVHVDASRLRVVTVSHTTTAHGAAVDEPWRVVASSPWNDGPPLPCCAWHPGLAPSRPTSSSRNSHVKAWRQPGGTAGPCSPTVSLWSPRNRTSNRQPSSGIHVSWHSSPSAVDRQARAGSAALAASSAFARAPVLEVQGLKVLSDDSGNSVLSKPPVVRYRSVPSPSCACRSIRMAAFRESGLVYNFSHVQRRALAGCARRFDLNEDRTSKRLRRIVVDAERSTAY